MVPSLAAVLVAGVVAADAADVAAAGATPDAEQLAALRERRRPALFVSTDATPKPVPAPIPWSQIQATRVAKPSGGAFKGILFGAITGIAHGAFLASVTDDPHGSSESEGYRRIGLFSSSVVLSAGAGQLIGGAHGWNTAYAAASP